jgi:hypothetical protein
MRRPLLLFAEKDFEAYREGSKYVMEHNDSVLSDMRQENKNKRNLLFTPMHISPVIFHRAMAMLSRRFSRMRRNRYLRWNGRMLT